MNHGRVVQGFGGMGRRRFRREAPAGHNAAETRVSRPERSSSSSRFALLTPEDHERRH